MSALLSELKQLSGKSLWATLDDKFRDFTMMSASSFALDEFDGNEQRMLIKLLHLVSKWGYSRVFARLSRSKTGQIIIDTAAGYGEFVDSDHCFSYLGVFIAAEAVQYPLSMDSYGFSMVRSACFRNQDSNLKIKILSLMHLARFVRNIDLSNELDLEIYKARIS